MTDICVLGLGYIGLPTASVLAANGFKVLGVDIARHVVDTINSGGIHIEEPGLHTLVQAAIGSGNLHAATAPESADVFIVAVPTPLTPDKRADMSCVISAAESLLPLLKKGDLVILESTSPPGTCRDLLKPILERTGLAVGRDLFLAHCPERVLPGKILQELIRNDRVIGGFDSESAEKARAVYARFVEGSIYLTDVTTAEMVKVIENTYRDVNIALANEAALLCEKLGISFWDVARFANRHPRVNVHNTGPGVGGHCISVDPWFLVEEFPEDARIIRLARERNDAMPAHVVSVVRNLLTGIVQPKVAVLGLAYKGNVDDIRESPAIHAVELLEAEGYRVNVYDPHVHRAPFALDTLETCLQDADCLLLLTAHQEYLDLDPAEAARRMRTRIVFDTHHLLEHSTWAQAGFQVRVLGIGRA